VQVIGLDPQHVRVVERHTRRDESAVFIELAGIDCKVTLAGRLNAKRPLVDSPRDRFTPLSHCRCEHGRYPAAVAGKRVSDAQRPLPPAPGGPL
jgi:hypothetical protein